MTRVGPTETEVLTIGSSRTRVKGRRVSLLDIALVLPALLIAILVVAYPLLQSILNSFLREDQGQGAYAWIMENTVYLDILRHTMFTGVLTVAMCLALGYPYAYLMTIVGGRWRAVLLMVALVPFWVSGLVRIFAWVILLQANGPVSMLFPFLGGEGILRTQLAVQIGLVQVLLPFMVLPLYNSMRTIDSRLFQAAESLGARRSVAFFRVFVPLSMPGVVAGSLIVLMLTVGYYVLPQMLGTPSTGMLGNAIYSQASQLGNHGRAGALSVLLIGSTIAVIALAFGLSRIIRRMVAR